MRPNQVLGLMLILIGALTLWNRPSDMSRQVPVKIMGLTIDPERRERILLWADIALIGGGLVLLFVGNRRKVSISDDR